jgi:hypothetical protein
MGAIVSTISYVECDSPGCRERTEGSYDQSRVRDLAMMAGWFVNYITGKCTCPKCSKEQTEELTGAKSW